jgi:hypothetical protein
MKEFINSLVIVVVILFLFSLFSRFVMKNKLLAYQVLFGTVLGIILPFVFVVVYGYRIGDGHSGIFTALIYIMPLGSIIGILVAGIIERKGSIIGLTIILGITYITTVLPAIVCRHNIGSMLKKNNDSQFHSFLGYLTIVYFLVMPLIIYLIINRLLAKTRSC